MANPTTNYGFVLPTSTDLVTDLPADFDVALQGVDTRIKALQPGTTAGDLVYASSTANTNVRLGIGTTGQNLTVVAGVPAWSAPATGGKVLQVVQATTTTEVTVASTSFTDTGLSLAITPTLATSKVLVIVNQAFSIDRASNNIAHGLNIVRVSTQVFTQNTANAGGGFFSSALAAITLSGTTPMTFLDSPATTSSITYKTQGKVNTTANTGVVYYQASTSTSVITLIEIGA